MRHAEAKRRVAILGDMGELGEDETKLHFETGKCAAENDVKLLITCSSLSKHTAAGAREAGLVNVHSFDTLPEVLEALPALIERGDRVLVKASHSMQFEKITAFLEQLALR
jgi:UDP-N-acetylmuramoyl-tripeptide--D-alanyl-D-alanine ligase